MQLSKKRIDWPFLEPPKYTCEINVLSILSTEEGSQRDELIKLWSEGVWNSWDYKHEWVKDICKDLIV